MRVTRRQCLAAAGAFGLALLAPSAGAREACGAPPHAPPLFPFRRPLQSIPLDRPSIEVEVTGANLQYRYLIDGRPRRIRGMGYNPKLAELAQAERSSILARDFSLMSSAGINTVFGWNPVEFNALLLDTAMDAGLGVAIPYDIDFEADARDPAVRLRARDDLESQVRQYAHHPATRLWAAGNEVFQRTVPPDWCNGSIPSDMNARSQALAELIVDLADLAHQLDPAHPVIYRESEDAYTSWLRQALRNVPANRPWLICGINAYTDRLAEILDLWPQREIPCPVVVSEFGLAQGIRGQRAQPLRDAWDVIRARQDYVLGGAAYVWYADGPEPGDVHHGLVGLDGEPVDDALAALGEVYRADGATS